MRFSIGIFMVGLTVLVSILYLFWSSNDPINVYENKSLAVEVKLKHNFANGAILYLDNGLEIIPFEMQVVGEDTFVLYEETIESSIVYDSQLKMNIKVFEANDPATYDWVVKPVGIDANYLRVFGQNLEARAIVSIEEYPNVATGFVLEENGGISKVVASSNSDYKYSGYSQIPPELPQTEFYCRYQVAPDGFRSIVPWVHTMTTDDGDNTSRLLIKEMKLFVTRDDEEKLIYSETYDSMDVSYYYEAGGIYLRYPFFYKEEDNNWPMPYEIEEDYMTMTTSEHPDRVYHFWTRERVVVPVEQNSIDLKRLSKSKAAPVYNLVLIFGVTKQLDTAV